MATRLDRKADRVARATAELRAARADLRAEVLKRLAKGESPVELAKLAGVSRMTVWTWAREAEQEGAA